MSTIGGESETNDQNSHSSFSHCVREPRSHFQNHCPRQTVPVGQQVLESMDVLVAMMIYHVATDHDPILN